MVRRVAPALCLLFPIFTAVLLPTGARADSCRYRADRSAEASTDGIRKVVVKAGAGSLEIRGEPGRQRMQAQGKACASDERQLELLHIRVERSGDTLVVSTTPETSLLEPKSWFGDESRLDVSINVPAGMALDLDDGSGDAHISNVGASEIHDGSGSLRIDGVAGSVVLDDGSGNVAIADVRGPVRIKDGTGEVHMQQITGDVTVENDGSGGLAILDVQGGVTILNDGSGQIRIERVGRSVHIKNDGSGDIQITGVKHDVTVDRDGSGEIVVQDVGGDMTIGKDGGGGVRHERIGGSISLADNES